MDEFQRFLQLSRYNPEFIRDYQYMLIQLESMYDKKQISFDEKVRLSNQLMVKREGVEVNGIHKTLSWFVTQKRTGYFNLNFNNEQLNNILICRKTCADFVKWLEFRRHKSFNDYAFHVLAQLSNKLVSLLKEPTEEIWEVIERLHHMSILMVARHLVSRSRMSQISEILLAGLKYRLNYTKSLTEKNIRSMNAFTDKDDEASLPGIDNDVVGIGLVKMYLTDLDGYSKMFNQIDQILMQNYQQGVINTGQHSRIKVSINKYVSAAANADVVAPADVLADFYISHVKGHNPDNCLVYNTEQVKEASALAREFYGQFTNERLMYEMIEKKLQIDLDRFDHSSVVMEKLNDSYMEIMDMFREHDIVNEETYAIYKEKGRVKFL